MKCNRKDVVRGPMYAAIVLVSLSISFGLVNQAFAVDSNVLTKSIQNSNIGCSPVNNCSNINGPQTQTAPIHTINSAGSILINVNNSVEIEQLQQKSNLNCVNVGIADCRNTVIAQTQLAPIATVTNGLSILNQVSNSATVEQEAILSNTGCSTAPGSCRNLVTAQTQLAPVAAVTNALSILNLVSNSAEVEQEATLSNVGCTAACLNTVGLQTQAAPIAAVTNALSILNQVSNSAAVEQEATLTNTGCTAACTNTLVAQTQTAPVAAVTNTLSILNEFLIARK